MTHLTTLHTILGVPGGPVNSYKNMPREGGCASHLVLCQTPSTVLFYLLADASTSSIGHEFKCWFKPSHAIITNLLNVFLKLKKKKNRKKIKSVLVKYDFVSVYYLSALST